MFTLYATIAINGVAVATGVADATKRLYPVRDTALISLSVDLNYLEWSNFHPNLTLAICDVFALYATIAKNGVAVAT